MEDVSLARKKNNLTQQEISNQLNISRQYYSEIENGNRQPSVRLAKKIAEILSIDWTIFFTK